MGGWSGQIRNSGLTRAIVSGRATVRVRAALALVALFVPLSLVLAQCGKAPNAGMLAANTQSASGDTFEDRFPAPAIQGSLPDRNRKVSCSGRSPAPPLQPQQSARTEPRRSAVASIAPTLTLPRPNEREELTTLVSMKSSAFPYFGNNPRSEAPFLNVTKGDRKGHRSYYGAGLLAGRDLQ